MTRIRLKGREKKKKSGWKRKWSDNVCAVRSIFLSLFLSFSIFFFSKLRPKQLKSTVNVTLISQHFTLATRHFRFTDLTAEHFMVEKHNSTLITQYVIVKCVAFHSGSNHCHNQLLDLCFLSDFHWLGVCLDESGSNRWTVVSLYAIVLIMTTINSLLNCFKTLFGQCPKGEF